MTITCMLASAVWGGSSSSAAICSNALAVLRSITTLRVELSWLARVHETPSAPHADQRRQWSRRGAESLHKVALAHTRLVRAISAMTIIDAAKVVVPDHAFFFVFAHRAECSQSQEQRSKLGSVIGASSTSPGQADSASVPTVHGTWARARPSASRS